MQIGQLLPSSSHQLVNGRWEGLKSWKGRSRCRDQSLTLRRRRGSQGVQAQKADVAFPPAPLILPKGDWTVLPRGITAPQGFRTAGIAAGLRSHGTREDLSLVSCEVPALATGVFTQNVLCAAPVTYDKNILAKQDTVRAVITNAGQANAATGPEGYLDAERCALAAAESLGVDRDEVLVMSTGVIGQRIRMDALLEHIPQLTQSLDAQLSSDIDAATAITTTDLAYKSGALEVEIDGQAVRLGGMCKGSGMINPDMATLLGVITCDAPVERSVWKEMLQRAVNLSFNRITVDGDTSTNDTILALTSRHVQIPTITDRSSQAGRQLEAAMIALSQGLAKSVAWDGEGATCLIEVTVHGAESDSDASVVAKSIASSNLTKAAIFGHDPNWGRIAAAAGYSGIPFPVEKLNITLGPTPLMQNGVPLDFDRSQASQYLREQCSDRGTVCIDASIGGGPGTGIAWGCDLSYDYVRINAEYTT